MSEGHVLWHDPVEHHLHVVPHVGVPVLVDGEAGGGVEQLDVHQTHRELGQLRQLKQINHFMLDLWLTEDKLWTKNCSTISQEE
jgi:2-methylisocitrate lyase-like PEP mutase family enzyme